ncbi:cell envelope integrity protein TolA [uncultured Desulfobacter sp.]|uniref:cell envelope integrity protein TolA n=1 Tax=uncultured Desulfobacter sp. TaxID=240139 RepID=UPI0029C6BB94|nr:cell envelope integrity protein TolA [uncultured Desulfobacter sp.]
MNIRSQIQNRQRFSSEPKSTGPKSFFLVCLLSLVCHVLFFISLYFLHDFQFSAPKPKIITVDLVTFAPGSVGPVGPAGPANAQTPGKAPVANESASDNAENVNLDALSQIPSQPAEPKAPEIPIIKPEVSLKSKPHNLKDLIAAREKKAPKKEPKKEPLPKKIVEKKEKQKDKASKKSEQDLAKAQKKQAEKIEKQRQAQLKDALARMKASVASKGGGAQGTNSYGNGGGTGAAGATGGGGGGVGEASSLTLYQMVIKSAIEQNWVFNDVMAGLNKDLEVRIFIKILKSGEIRDISFETRSGNNYLDESAKKAIKRANPLPELPKGMFSYELVLGFSPRGLK